MERMNKGDHVNVFFERAEAELNVEVVGIPASQGDSWTFNRMDGTLVDVQTYAKIVRLRKAPDIAAKSAASLGPADSGPADTANYTPDQPKEDPDK